MRRLALSILLALGAAAPAAASGPPLTVSKAKLRAAYTCPIPAAEHPTETPVMFVTGTGASGDQGYLIGQDAFEAAGHPVCYMNFPDNTTADIQKSVEYLVYGLRRQYTESGRRKLAVIGISQGRPAAALRAHLLARPAQEGLRRGGRRRHPARHHRLPRLREDHAVHAGELAADEGLRPARRAQRAAG